MQFTPNVGAVATLTPNPYILDSYDSFTYNLASLCRQAIPNCSIHIIKNDAISITDLIPLLDYFSAIIVGPGPGSPENAADIGVVKDIWKVADRHLLPIFGVCLGLQSLAVEFGAQLKRLNVVKHGQISNIEHEGAEIFKGAGDVSAVRYHSLHVELRGNEELEPLAWADDGEENGRVIMALKHRTKPFWAVQYHPESVCTKGGGDEAVRNFWRLATNWVSIHRRVVRPWDVSVENLVGHSWPKVHLEPISRNCSSVVSTKTLEVPKLEVAEICEALGVGHEPSDFVMLESSAQPGRFTIIGCLTAASPRITYSLGDRCVRIKSHDVYDFKELGSTDVWTWLAAFMRTRRAQGGRKEIPFWGGLVGYLSYELGVDSLTTLPPRDAEDTVQRHPDVNLVFVERSIVVDTVSGRCHIQSLASNDGPWLEATSSLLQRLGRRDAATSPSHPSKRARTTNVTVAPSVTLPDRASYIEKIVKAKEFLFSGDSYELCVTAPTRISVPKILTPSSERNSSSWELYKILRRRNPAPHSAYMRLHPSTLLSSSPERFLSFSRPPSIVCQLRPIKGTVRKGPGITRAVAEEALAGSKKEVAENLMIVDLIRHDLHGVVGEDVRVKQFCTVEEYETVWQLVSVIEGKLDDSIGDQTDLDLGWEVLQRSLPPGSMTGAPKKRSVEILQHLEDQDRNIYSAASSTTLNRLVRKTVPPAPTSPMHEGPNS
ncbi:Aminodeoxychorismate synthase [Grifola frondosa]|uniref:aminodeoxychorismate synthase n=1 Tax=Grifola frondosa TaxID=5627 RepID=A0A1C7MT08_GRIFR|nr:Aminodeoxychorismate synthase [Grifola frondosa]